jgi:hypothetical protein
VVTQICLFADCKNNEIPLEQNLEIKCVVIAVTVDRLHHGVP